MIKEFFLSAFFITLSFCISAQRKELVFATYTYSTNNRLQNLVPLTKYLSEKSGLTIKAKSYSTVQSLINAIKNDSVDFAMMNTSGYLVLQRNYPDIISPMVNLDMGNANSTNYGGCLIASKQSGIQSIADLLNHQQPISLVLVNSSSTSGNLMPRLMLNEKGISSAEEKFKVYYAGTHKKVVQDVLNGKANIGGCGCNEVDSARKTFQFDEKVVVIGSYNNIPLGPVVYNNKLNKKVREKVIDLMTNLHVNKYEVFANFCNGWTEFKEAIKFKPVTDKEYGAFRLLFGSNESLWKLIE
jgi:phosphonate transport system substrate-binding protein